MNDETSPDREPAKRSPQEALAAGAITAIAFLLTPLLSRFLGIDMDSAYGLGTAVICLILAFTIFCAKRFAQRRPPP